MNLLSSDCFSYEVFRKLEGSCNSSLDWREDDCKQAEVGDVMISPGQL